MRRSELIALCHDTPQLRAVGATLKPGGEDQGTTVCQFKAFKKSLIVVHQ